MSQWRRISHTLPSCLLTHVALLSHLQKVLELPSLLNGEQPIVVPLQEVVVHLLVVSDTNSIAVGVHSLPHQEGAILQAKSPKQRLTLVSTQVPVEPCLRLVQNTSHQLLKGSSAVAQGLLHLLRLGGGGERGREGRKGEGVGEGQGGRGRGEEEGGEKGRGERGTEKYIEEGRGTEGGGLKVLYGSKYTHTHTHTHTDDTQYTPNHPDKW